MSGVACLGDTTTHGGKVTTATSAFFINGVRVALVGDLTSYPEHDVSPIQKGDPTAAEKGCDVVANHYQCARGCKVTSS